MKNPNLEFIGEEVSEELNDMGVELSEAFAKRLRDFDIEDFTQDLLSELYDELVGQYNTFSKKIKDNFDKKTAALAEKVRDEILKLKKEARAVEAEEDKAKIEDAIKRYEGFDTVTEIQDLAGQMLETKVPKQMSFIDFILQDY